jgi:serine/threonine protein kinase
MENIMFKSRGSIEELKIIDFGLSIFQSEKKPLFVCGTPGYIAPEVIRSEDWDISD